MNPIIVRNLHKSFGAHRALRGISFSAARGEVLAILGPNGAGKTTTVEILQGYLPATQGDVSVFGYEPLRAGPALRDRTGAVLQVSSLYDELTVRETLELFAGYYARPRAPREVIDLVGLAGKAGVRVGALSGGEKRRLDFSLAVVGDPELLFLDEPTTGFDVEVRRKFWGDIAVFAASGKTVILTTHYLEEAQKLADRVLVLNQGRIIAEGPPNQLGKPITTIRFNLPESRRPTDFPEALRQQATVTGNAVTIDTETPEVTLSVLTSWARTNRISLEHLEVKKPSLEQAYLELLAEGSTEEVVQQ